MVRAVVPFAAGIAAAVRWNVPLAAALGGMALCGVLALRLRSQLYTALSLFLFGFAIALLHAPAHTVPCGVRTDFELVLNTASAARGGYHACEAQSRSSFGPTAGCGCGPATGSYVRAACAPSPIGIPITGGG